MRGYGSGMDRDAIHRAMNEGARRVAVVVRPTEPGSWTRLLDYATGRSWDGEELVALLTVAYEIGEQDGESERDMYELVAQLRELCDEKMVDAVGGGRTDADTIWPSQVLAILDQVEP
jgi:thiamine monophosphate synthase